MSTEAPVGTAVAGVVTEATAAAIRTNWQQARRREDHRQEQDEVPGRFGSHRGIHSSADAGGAEGMRTVANSTVAKAVVGSVDKDGRILARTEVDAMSKGDSVAAAARAAKVRNGSMPVVRRAEAKGSADMTASPTTIAGAEIVADTNARMEGNRLQVPGGDITDVSISESK